MTFNELYGQVDRADCGWLVVVSLTDGIAVYQVTNSDPVCNPNTYYFFQDDQLVDINQGQLPEQ